MPANNHIVTLFGGTGDLTYRKLIPAFYNLYETQSLPESFHVVVIGRQELTTKEYRENLKSWIKEHSRHHVSDEKISGFLNCVTYFKMVFTEAEGYARLHTYFDELDAAYGHHEKLFYFAVDPSFFITIAQYLDTNNLAENSKIIIEKPFGKDLESALEINNTLQEIFSDNSIYRIDHYIAKEMVQNILTLRFGNILFDQTWNHTMISSIQITALEEVGVENRGNFYDVTGALQDMFQSHLLQILSIVMMDKPESMEAHHIHKVQEDALNKLMIRDPKTDIVFGQYEGYREEPKVNTASETETYVALRLEIDNQNWKNVPIYVRTGKKMHRRATEVVVEFKAMEGYPPNMLVIKIQPDEGVYFKLNIKRPGHTYETETIFMDYCQSCHLEFRNNTPEAYERLLDAAMNEDHTLFATFNQVERSWAFTEQLIQMSKENKIHAYAPYSDGPSAAKQLLAKENHEWFEDTVYGEIYHSEE